MDPALVRSMLTDLLDVAVTSLTPDGSDPDDPRTTPPDRQLVAHGSAFAFDCELVATALTRLTLDRPAVGGCIVVPTATLAAYVLRCYPKAGDNDDPIPDAATIDAAATGLAVDAAALSGGIADAWGDGTLFSSAAIGCNRITISPGVEPLGPSGGLAGWRVTLDVKF